MYDDSKHMIVNLPNILNILLLTIKIETGYRLGQMVWYEFRVDSEPKFEGFS